jgi:glycosyltransferase involved in cell wall biosynthesis
MQRLFRRSKLLTSAAMVDDLPSVSVCIPARNEGHAMADCLDRVIASTYPKLEIIVLDDESGDTTSALIKAYAHDGVRFVEGQPLEQGWLGKNHSLNELLDEASGTYVLFMDVDTRISPGTIEQLVAYAMQEKAAMVSVLPRREDSIRASILFSPLRYFWEIVFHSKQRPAVASSAWMLRRDSFIKKFTDFSQFKSVVQPEAAIAKAYSNESSYRFLIGTPMLGIAYEKKWSSQKDTSVRLLYPLLGSRLSRSLIAAMDLLLLIVPLVITTFAIIDARAVEAALGVAMYFFTASVFFAYYQLVWRQGALVGAALWPIVVTQEAILIALSTIRHRQNSVTWKGRPVTVTTEK